MMKLVRQCPISTVDNAGEMLRNLLINDQLLGH